MAAPFEINCTNVLSLDCKSAAILEINKPRYRPKISENGYRQIYVTNVYIETGIDWDRSWINFFRVKKKLQSAYFL